jgi:hypothetical protein
LSAAVRIINSKMRRARIEDAQGADRRWIEDLLSADDCE